MGSSQEFLVATFGALFCWSQCGGPFCSYPLPDNSQDASTLAELQAQKQAAIAQEDFDEAKRIKLEMEAIQDKDVGIPLAPGGPAAQAVKLLTHDQARQIR